MNEESAPRGVQITVRALRLGDRIETAGLERKDVLSTVPLAFRAGERGVVALFRYGVAVFLGCRHSKRMMSYVGWRAGSSIRRNGARRETVFVDICSDKEDQVTPAGIIAVRVLTDEHTLLIADALATSVILAHDERDVAAVFDVIEPLARQLAEHGRTPR